MADSSDPEPGPDEGRASSSEALLDREFSRASSRIRVRLALSTALSGATLGGVLAVAASAAAWWWGRGELRPFGALLIPAGALLAVVGSRRWRWSDEEVALYLDEALGSKEAVVTAIGLQDRTAAAARLVMVAAVSALASGAPSPRVARRWHALFPAALACVMGIGRLALPVRANAPPSAPGLERVQLEELEGLDEVRALSKLEARDEEQRRRLKALAERADRLARELREGTPRREAQAELARLREEVAAERQRFGAGDSRRGLEAALGKLAKSPALEEASKSLGDRDFTRLDRAMEELADRLEESDRNAARRTLEEAAAAARREGAEDVARSLEDQARRLEARGAEADALRELAKAFGDGLTPEAKRALEGMKGNGDERDRADLGRSLAEALSELNEEDRKRLARKLADAAKGLDSNGSGAASREELERMRRELDTKEGRRELAERLREFARAPDASPDASRQRALEDAERGLGAGESRLHGAPMPMASGGGASGRGRAPSNVGPRSGEPPENGVAAPSRGGGPGTHGGTTPRIDGDGVKAHATAPLNAGAPNPGGVVGRAPALPGETARAGGEGRLGVVAPGEVAGASRSEIPREYREQVGRYFPAR